MPATDRQVRILLAADDVAAAEEAWLAARAEEERLSRERFAAEERQDEAEQQLREARNALSLALRRQPEELPAD